MKTTTKLCWGIGILLILSPLGLLLPAYFKSGPAWGEWEIANRLSNLWHAPLPGYTISGLGDNPAYIISAIIGIAATVILVWLIGKYLTKKGK